MTISCEPEQQVAAMTAVSAVLDCFHRVLICLDADFRVVHASPALAGLIGDEAARMLEGRPVQHLLGDELFGRGGALRDVLEKGELREGWRASVRTPDGTRRLVSCSAAPFKRDPRGICDPNVAYVIVVRSEPLNSADTLRLALEQNRWDRNATARALGVSRTTLWRKMREAGLTNSVSPRISMQPA